MFARLNVPATRQPESCILMIHEQDVLLIHQNEIGHEMLRRCRRFLSSAQLHAGVEPRKRIFPMGALERVEGLYGGDLFSNGRARIVRYHGRILECRGDSDHLE
jgi:hypothetical protein